MYLWFLGTIYVPPEEILPAAFIFYCYFVLPRERLVTQSAAPLYAEIPADSLNALRLNERNPQGRTVRFSRLFH